MRVAVCAKQVPQVEGWGLGPDGRLRRQGLAVEMNAFCRRAVAQGVRMARAGGGTCTVLTMGPPSAELVAREALACGADRAVVICDPLLAGADTLITARALAAAIRRVGPFDLVLVGRSSIDADTAQVGPELAELLGLPFAGPARQMELRGGALWLLAQLDDGDVEATIGLPATVSTAERLIAPAKADPVAIAAADARAIAWLRAGDLGADVRAEASPTRVLRTVDHTMARAGVRLAGPPDRQALAAVELMAAAGALPWSEGGDADGALASGPPARPRRPAADGPAVLVLLEPGHDRVARELLAGAARLAAALGGEVVAVEAVAAAGEPGWESSQLGGWGADRVVRLVGSRLADDLVEAVAGLLIPPAQVLLAPSTDWGRELAGRVAARCGLGLTGDAVDVAAAPDGVVCWKPALGGRVVAVIGSSSRVVMATVRPGAWRAAPPRPAVPPRVDVAVTPRRRVVQAARRWDDIPARIQAARTLVGVGAGVPPDAYPGLEPLLRLLDAELVATRRVTDRGWLPRSRQVGLTGHGAAPRLYLALGISGALNHLVGTAAAGLVVAVNTDPEAPVLAMADAGIVGDVAEVVPLLSAALAADRLRSAPRPGAGARVRG